MKRGMKKEWLATWPKPYSPDFVKLGWATRLTKQEKKGIFATLKREDKHVTYRTGDTR